MVNFLFFSGIGWALVVAGRVQTVPVRLPIDVNIGVAHVSPDALFYAGIVVNVLTTWPVWQ